MKIPITKRIMLTVTAAGLVLGSSLCAQQIELQGQVSIHNSKYETGKIQYVDNAFVSAPFTKPSSSDTQGRFKLEFVGLDPGTAIALAAEKDGLEVVNAYDLKEVVISRKLPLRIYLTDKGKLAAAQTELYNISKEALYARKDALIARLQKNDEDTKAALKELEAYFGHPIDNRFQAETELIERIENLEKRLPEFAQSLAEQNLDFASDRYIKAYEYFRAGSIEQAIETLDSLSLQQDYEQARETIAAGEELQKQGGDLIEKGNEQLTQLIESYRLKARSYALLFQYGEMTAINEQLITIYKENDLDQQGLAELYWRVALSNFDDGKYESCQKYLDEYLAILDTLEGDWRLERSLAYGKYAESYERIRQSSKGIEYMLKDLAIKEELLDSNDVRLATSYNNIGLLYTRTGDTANARKYLFKGLDIRLSQLDPDHFDLTESYNDIALFHTYINQYEKAIAWDKKALEIRLRTLEPNHPALALTYSNLGWDHYLNTKYYLADEYYQKAASIREEILDPNHPDLALTYSNMAQNFSRMGNFQQELVYRKKIFSIRANIYGKEDKRMSGSYRTLGLAYRANDINDSAVAATMKGVELVLTRIDSNHRSMGLYYNSAYLAHLNAGNLDDALVFAKLLLKSRKTHYKNNPKGLYQGYAALSSVYNAKGDYQKGVENQLIAHDLVLEGWGEKHPTFGLNSANLAYSYYMAGEHQQALKYQQLALDVLLKSYKSDHFLVVRGTIRMGVFHLAHRDLDKAKEYRDRATQLLSNIDEANRKDLPKLLEELNQDITNYKI